MTIQKQLDRLIQGQAEILELIHQLMKKVDIINSIIGSPPAEVNAGELDEKTLRQLEKFLERGGEAKPYTPPPTIPLTPNDWPPAFTPFAIQKEDS